MDNNLVLSILGANESTFLQDDTFIKTHISDLSSIILRSDILGTDDLFRVVCDTMHNNITLSDNYDGHIDACKCLTAVSSMTERLFPDSVDSVYDVFHPHPNATVTAFLIYLLAFCKAKGLITEYPTVYDIRIMLMWLTSNIPVSEDVIQDTVRSMKEKGIKENSSVQEIYSHIDETMDISVVLSVMLSGQIQTTKLSLMSYAAAFIAEQCLTELKAAVHTVGHRGEVLKDMCHIFAENKSLVSILTGSGENHERVNEIITAFNHVTGEATIDPVVLYDKFISYFFENLPLRRSVPAAGTALCN